MTLPSVKDIADELILASDITAERFFRDGVCRAITSQYPWGYLVSNYYQAHNLVAETPELTFGYLNEVRDAVFDAVIIEAATDPKLRDILLDACVEDDVTTDDITEEPGSDVWRNTVTDKAADTVNRLVETILTDLHKAVIVAYHGGNVPDVGDDKLPACVALVMCDVLHCEAMAPLIDA